MIKCRTIGQLDIAKINPVLTSVNAVANYAFIVSDGVTYLVLQDVNGDDAYKEGLTFPAGTYLNGYDVSAWENQELVADEKHITYGSGEDYDDIVAGTTLFTIKADGTLEIASSAPKTLGTVYFKAVGKTTLTEKAVILKVYVVGDATE